jgi:Outer membrane protein beta-barrel domain
MRKIGLSLTMIAISIIGFSQSEDVDAKRLKFGFNLGLNYSNLQSKEILPTNSEIYNGFGIEFGIFLDYKIASNLFLSPKAEVLFNKSGIYTTNTNGEVISYKVFPSSAEIMMHLKYRIGKKKTKPYLLLGPKYRYSLVQSNSSTSFGNNSDFAIDIGIGLENNLSYFVFSPEIKILLDY